MYTWFYGFTEEPFNVDPDPAFLFFPASYRKALDSVLGGMSARKDIIVLLGESGSGKTTLIQHLLRSLGPDVKAVPLFRPPATLEEMLEGVLRGIGISAIPQDRASLVRQLNDFLHGLNPDQTLAILMDEAQELSPDLIDELRPLLKTQLVSADNVQVLLAGERKLKAKLDGLKLKERAEEIAELRPLNEQECRDYIIHRLRKVDGDPSAVFTAGAISLICRNAKGNPRTINTLCDNALLIGYGLSRKKVDEAIVTEVLEGLNSTAQHPFPRWTSPQMTKFRIPGTTARGPVFRKLSYSLLVLAAVGLTILVGRIYLRTPEEPPSVRFPIRSAESRPGGASERGDNKPEGRSGISQAPVSGPGSNLSAPPGTEEPGGAKPAEKTARVREGKSLVPPTGDEVKRENEEIGERNFVSRSGSEETRPKSGGVRFKQDVVVKGGDSVYSIAAKAYHVANTSVVDQILEFNPRIANPNRLLANEKIRIPEITEESLVIPSSDGSCKIRLGTFLKPDYAKFLKNHPALQGKEIEFIPRKLPSGQTWYRAAVKFGSREEGLRVVRDLRAKGQSPYFAGFKKNR